MPQQVHMVRLYHTPSACSEEQGEGDKSYTNAGEEMDKGSQEIIRLFHPSTHLWLFVHNTIT